MCQYLLRGHSSQRNFIHSANILCSAIDAESRRGDLGAHLGSFYAGSWIRTSENTATETVRKGWIGTESVLYQAQQMARQGSISAPRAPEDPGYSLIASFRKDANHLRKSSPVKHFKAAR